MWSRTFYQGVIIELTLEVAKNRGLFNDEIDFAGSEGLVSMEADTPSVLRFQSHRIPYEVHALVLTDAPFSRVYNGTRDELSYHQEGSVRKRVGQDMWVAETLLWTRDKARASVCGYGDVGKACVFAFRGSGARVFVAECELLSALQACFKGVQASCLKSTSLFLSTGNFNISILGLMKKLENNAFVLWKHQTL